MIGNNDEYNQDQDHRDGQVSSDGGSQHRFGDSEVQFLSIPCVACGCSCDCAAKSEIQYDGDDKNYDPKSLFDEFLKLFKIKLSSRKAQWNFSTEPVPICVDCKYNLGMLTELQNKLEELERTLRNGKREFKEKCQMSEGRFELNHIYSLDMRYFRIRRYIHGGTGSKFAKEPILPRRRSERYKNKCEKGKPESSARLLRRDNHLDSGVLDQEQCKLGETQELRDDEQPKIRVLHTEGNFHQDIGNRGESSATMRGILPTCDPAIISLKSHGRKPKKAGKANSRIIINRNVKLRVNNLRSQKNRSIRNKNEKRKASIMEGLKIEKTKPRKSQSRKKTNTSNDYGKLSGKKDSADEQECPVTELELFLEDRNNDNDVAVRQATRRKREEDPDFIIDDQMVNSAAEDEDEDMGNDTRKERMRLDFNTGIYWYLHVSFTKQEDGRYQCLACDSKTVLLNRVSIKSHAIGTHTNSIVCKMCDKSCGSQSCLRRHIRRVHQGVSDHKLIECPICGKPCDRTYTFERHKITHYSEQDKIDAEARGEKIFTWSGSKKLRFQCEQCGKGFSGAYELKRHEEARHASATEKMEVGCESRIVCPECGKTFKNNYYFKVHMRRSHCLPEDETKVKPFVCTYCEKRFHTSSRLLRHKVVHTKLRPFKCPLCPKELSTKINLDNHMMQHQNIRPFPCSHCSMSFVTKAHVQRHEKTFHSVGATPRRKSYIRGPETVASNKRNPE